MIFPSQITALSWQRGLHNSMKLQAMLCRVTQDEQVVVKSSDKMWTSGGGNGNPVQYSCLENPMSSMKRQKDMVPEDDPFRLEGVQYATGKEQMEITNISRKNEAAGPNQK